METLPRFLKPPRDHFLLLRPRGTGKTWWTRKSFPDALQIDLLDPETLRSLSARPERMRELIAARPKARQVVVDEVQKLPDLLEVAHGLIEERRDTQFIFTGSKVY